jgi:hypothetical protein
VKRLLVACECSGTVRDAFRKRGIDAVSCDIKPSETEGPHYCCDVIPLLNDGWDAIIGFPDCTYLCSSGLHWNCRTKGRAALTRQAIDFAEAIWNADCPLIAIENPIGCLPTFSNLRKYSQIIQPYEFGHDASKSTCLWLKGLPKLQPTQYIEPRIVNGKPRWSNQTDSGQNKLGPSEQRAADRARTYQGIADAMADQWSDRIHQESIKTPSVRLMDSIERKSNPSNPSKLNLMDSAT